MDALSDLTPLDAAIELQGLPQLAPPGPSGPSSISEAPVSQPTVPPRGNAASLPGEPDPAARRLAPWIAIAAIAGIGIGLVGRGAVGRDAARGTAVAAPIAAAPGAPTATAPATAGARGTEAQVLRDERAAVAGIAETSAISRPSGTWKMPVPAAPGAAPATPTSAASAVATASAEGARPEEEEPPATTPADAAAAPAAPGGDNLANPYGATAPAPEGEAAPTPTTDAPFDRGAAMAALATATAAAAGCRKDDAPTGTTRVAVTFAPSGRVTQATVSGAPYAGTPTGGCIAQAFRGVSIGPFQGDPVTVTKSVSIR